MRKQLLQSFEEISNTYKGKLLTIMIPLTQAIYIVKKRVRLTHDPKPALSKLHASSWRQPVEIEFPCCEQALLKTRYHLSLHAYGPRDGQPRDGQPRPSRVLVKTSYYRPLYDLYDVLIMLAL